MHCIPMAWGLMQNVYRYENFLIRAERPKFQTNHTKVTSLVENRERPFPRFRPKKSIEEELRCNFSEKFNTQPPMVSRRYDIHSSVRNFQDLLFQMAKVGITEAEVFLRKVEDRLTGLSWLGGEAPSVTDVALFPFVRQFAGVEPAWWQGAPYPGTRIWLAQWLEGPLFSAVMTKYPRWEPGQPGARFPAEPCSAETVHWVTAQ